MRVAIGGSVRRLGYTYDVWYAHARAIRGGVWSYGAPLLGTPLLCSSKLPVDEVCRQFGSFAKMNCDKIEASTSSDVGDPVQLNVFQDLMMNQRALSSKSNCQLV